MYQLPHSNNKLLQRTITSELIYGFCFVFDAHGAGDYILSLEDDEVNDEQNQDLVQEALNVIRHTLKDVSWVQSLNETELMKLYAKIRKMYHELLDEEYAYTFDELGEFLMYKFILSVKKECNECDIDWDLKISYFDKLELKKYFLEDAQLLVEDMGYDSEEDKEEACERYVCQYINSLMFVSMSPNEPFDMIFRDYDFIFFDNAENIANLLSCSRELGLIIGDPNTEPVSGSIKLPIKQKSGD